MKNKIMLIIVMVFLFCIYSCSSDNSSKTSVENSLENTENNNTTISEGELSIVLDEKEEIKPQNKRYVIARLNVRSNASTNGEIVGHAEEGDIYEVLESTKDDKYTWYRIGDNKWIADDGTWTSEAKTIKFKSNNGSKEEYIQEYADEQEYNTMDYRTIDKNRFSFDGYIFTGWNREPDGSGEKIFENSPAKNALNDAKAVCLYAQWEPIIGKDIIVEASEEIDLLFSPDIETKYIQGVLQKGDRFKIYDQINYQDEVWNRISKDLWFIESDDCYSIVDSLPTINVDFKEFHKPVRVNNGFESEILHYNGDDLVLIEKPESYYENNGTDTFFSLFSSWMLPNYRYGPGVTTKYDEIGRISEQSVKVYDTTVHQTYTYDSNNKIVSKEEWYKSPGDSGNLVHYEYYEDGKLKRLYLDAGGYNSKYTFGNEFEYNGNLVFEYHVMYSYSEEHNSSCQFQQLLRYDNYGRLIQVYYPDSPQIEGPMISNYYYE